MSSVAIASLVGIVILAGAVVGASMRTRLPDPHLDADTKDIVKAGIGLLSTLSALVLGLIIGASKNTFDAQAADVQSVAAKLALLDATLRQAGPGAAPIRATLLKVVDSRLSEIWGERTSEGFAVIARHGDAAFGAREAIAGVVPATESQREALAKAAQVADELLQTRLLAMSHSQSPITPPLLTLLAFWFAVIALGLNLFAPRNPVVRTMNLVCALSVAGAIFLILEMEKPFGGWIRISDAPLRAALDQMRR